MRVKEQSEAFMTNLQTRKRNRVKPATIALYRSIINNHILPAFGEMELSLVKNGEMKRLSAQLIEKELKPASIQVILTVLKSIVKSLTDDQGNVVHSIAWNSTFIDSPLVNPRDQKAPTISSEGISKAISNAGSQYKALYALLAGSGLRVSEAFSLRVGVDDGKSSFWNRDTCTLHVRQQMYRGNEQDTKTQAGVRDVDICTQLNEYVIKNTSITSGLLFANSEGKPLELTGSLYQILHRDGIPGYHSLRRFRVSHLRSNQVPESLVKYSVGHGGGSITDRYDKSSTDVVWRKEWAEKVGLGFELPEDTK